MHRLDEARRRVLNWLVGTAFAAVGFFPILRFITPPRLPEAATDQVDAGPVNDPELIARGYRIIRFGNEPVILVRVAPDDLRAFSATCTHLDCIVEYRKDVRRIWCNCHNGEYDLQGRVVAGPPPRPLSAFRVDLVEHAAGSPQTILVSRA